jgi:hypothetical protein
MLVFSSIAVVIKFHEGPRGPDRLTVFVVARQR